MQIQMFTPTIKLTSKLNIAVQDHQSSFLGFIAPPLKIKLNSLPVNASHKKQPARIHFFFGRQKLPHAQWGNTSEPKYAHFPLPCGIAGF